MELINLIQNQNVTISITGEQLNEFANQILTGARSIFEKEEQPEQYLTRKQVAELLQVDLSTLWRWNKESYLNPVEIGGKRKYKLSEVNKILGR
jgi:predicted DNA-binding transcriptional regulator AlpA